MRPFRIALISIGVLSFALAVLAEHRQGEILVKYKPAAHGLAANVAASVAGASVTASLDKIRTKLVKLPPGLSVEDAIARFKADPNVEYAGPNHVVRLCIEPNDEFFYDDTLGMYWQWGLYDETNPDAGIQAPDAWDIETGSPNVIIAIIDTGIQSAHEDLYAKIVPGQNCIAGADPTNYEDDHGHGTFVAGVAAAMTDNSIGIAGVSWGSMLMPVKVISSTGEGSEQDAAAGIIWAADHGAKVLNLSFGGYDDVQAEHDAVDYAWSKGCIVVAASGNDNSGALFYPASYSHCLSTGATNESRQRCSTADWGTGAGSNYGSYLDVVAPGNNIFSTTISDDFGLGPYTIEAGTSAAAPFVSGVAALVLSHYPTWTNSQVVEQIENTATDLDPAGWDQYTGWGLVNAYHALADPPLQSTTIADLAHLTLPSKVKVSDAVLTSSSGMLYDRFYAEQANRVCGVCLPFAQPPTGYNEGDVVQLSGMLKSVNGELAISEPIFTLTGHQTPLAPWGMSTKAVGGAAIGQKTGVSNGRGLNNISLLVTVCGRVTAVGWNYFYLDDGASQFDGSGMTGLKVFTDQLNPPTQNSYVRVTGISSVEQPPRTSVTIPLIRVRKQSDITTMP